MAEIRKVDREEMLGYTKDVAAMSNKPLQEAMQGESETAGKKLYMEHLRAKDAEIVFFRQRQVDLSVELNNLISKLSDREQMIRALKDELATLLVQRNFAREKADLRERMLKEKNEDIESLTRKLEGMREDLVASEDHAERLDALLQTRDAETESLKAELSLRQSQIAALEKLVNYTQNKGSEDYV